MAYMMKKEIYRGFHINFSASSENDHIAKGRVVVASADNKKYAFVLSGKSKVQVFDEVKDHIDRLLKGE